eukprot:CAMPEP_0205807832 /NCGR_PEP_ID=MMETSP0205-20121125/11605_1 /ASSEMBLY_ACC=CAM_ASM_000278 /TAXON_ID=36767 /ORGANISM="Euplotes focardii, Strain TN1" /LENGTH=186 /DNA_ID=CAMNT_0053082543 /DNA_START=85 /DNA_END=645 /DNA_ORIENTATION=-
MSQNGINVGAEEIISNLNTEVEITLEDGHDSNDSSIDNTEFYIMVNWKNQIVKVSKLHNIFKPVEAEVEEQHEVIDFFIHELPQASQHTVTSKEKVVKSSAKKIFNYGASKEAGFEEDKQEFGEEEEDDAPTFGGLINKRRKVAVKDGISQQALILMNKNAESAVENPNQIFYTLEDVKKHRKAND